MKIGDHPVDLMVDTEVEYSVVTQPVGCFSQKHATIIGAMGNWAHCPFLVSRQCNLGSHEEGMNSFIPDCPVGLMARDLLCKLRAQITFDSDGIVALKLRGPEARVLTLKVT
jgi:hypothetical protein